MARTYEHRFANGYSTLSFISARYRRFWPVMAIGTLIGAPMAWIELQNPALFFSVALTNLLLIPAVVGTIPFPLNFPTWSIFAELVANLVHSAIFRRWRTWMLGLFFCGMSLAVIHFGLSDGTTGAGVPAAVARAVFAYCGGIIFWRWWQDRPSFNIHPGLAFAAMPAAVLASHVWHIESWVFDLVYIVVLCPLVIAGGLRYARDHWASTWLGALSFPLYAINLPILHWTEGLGLSVAVGIMFSLFLALLIGVRMTPSLRMTARTAAA